MNVVLILDLILLLFLLRLLFYLLLFLLHALFLALELLLSSGHFLGLRLSWLLGFFGDRLLSLLTL